MFKIRRGKAEHPTPNTQHPTPNFPPPTRSMLACETLGQALGEAAESGALVHGVEMDIEEAEALGMFAGGVQGGVELLLGLDEKAAAFAEHFGQLVVFPVEHVV